MSFKYAIQPLDCKSIYLINYLSTLIITLTPMLMAKTKQIASDKKKDENDDCYTP